MQIEPAADAFGQTYAAGQAQVVWTTLVADLETPVSAFLKIAAGKPSSFLLESVEGGAVRGRYSIIGLEPDLVWRTVEGRAEINRSARAGNGHPHGSWFATGGNTCLGLQVRGQTCPGRVCRGVARRWRGLTPVAIVPVRRQPV